MRCLDSTCSDRFCYFIGSKNKKNDDKAGDDTIKEMLKYRDYKVLLFVIVVVVIFAVVLLLLLLLWF